MSEFGPISSHKIEEIEIPKPQDNDVLIEVYAAGVAFPDVLVVQGLYQIKPDFPIFTRGRVCRCHKKYWLKGQRMERGDRVIGFKGSGVFRICSMQSIQYYASPRFNGLSYRLNISLELWNINPRL